MRDKSRSVAPFSDEKQRVVLNLQQLYASWIEVERAFMALPYGMKWKTIAGRDYLYEIADRRGNGTSRGRRSPENEQRYRGYVERKAALKSQHAGLRERLGEVCRQYRALGLPLVPSDAAAILREADRRGLLGSHLIVVGTSAMPAYSIEAGVTFVGGIGGT